MNHRYLCFTNSLLLLTLLYFSIQISRSKVHAIEYVLAFGLVVTIALSQLFWFHPIRGSLLHRIDALNAKVVVACFILYVLSYKFRWSFVLLVGLIFFSFTTCLVFYRNFVRLFPVRLRNFLRLVRPPSCNPLFNLSFRSSVSFVNTPTICT